MQLIFTILISIALVSIFTYLSCKLKIPLVVGFIIAGIIIGYPAINDFIIGDNIDFILSLGNLGFISMMFLAGLESSKKLLFAEEKDSFFISLMNTLFSFSLGFIIFYLMGFSLIISIIIGICMSITAEGTNSEILLALRKLRTKVGSAIVDSGLLDDLIGVFLFVLFTILIGEIMIKEYFLLGAALLAFFVGVGAESIRDNIFFKSLKKTLLHFIVPFFFITMGLLFNTNSLIANPHILILIIVIALVGKIVGTLIAKPFTQFSYKQLYLIGWAMNSRGAIELALALIAFRSSLIPIEIYSSLVVMAIITTLIFPFIITRMIKNNKKIMGA